MTASGRLKRVGQQTATLTVAATLGQGAVIGRDLFVAAHVGLSGDLDALLLGWALAMAATAILTSGPQTALIASIGEMRTQGELGAARSMGTAVLLITTIAGGILALAIALAAPVILRVVGAGLDPIARSHAQAYLQLLATTVGFGAAAAILSSILQADGRFRALGWGWVAGPVASLVVTVALWSNAGLTGYALGLAAGSAVGAFILLASAVLGGNLQPRLTTIRRSDWRQLLHHALPLSAGSAVLQLNPLVQRFVASFIGVGAVSALRYGELIVRAPLYAAGPAWQAVSYPALAEIGQRAIDELGATAEAAMRFVLVAFVPASAALAVTAPLLVDAVYAHGALAASGAREISLLVVVLAPQLVVQATQPVLVGTLNAQRRGTLMGLLAAANVVLTGSFSVVLAVWWGVLGLGVASTLSSLTILLVMLRSVSIRNFSTARIRTTGVRAAWVSGTIALPAAFIGWWVVSPAGWLGDLVMATLIVVVSGVAYVVVGKRLRIDELALLVGTLRAGMSSRMKAITGER